MAPQIIDNRFVLVEGNEHAGGAADVRKAVDLQAGGATVAIKLFRTAERDATLQVFFGREKDILRSLDHPHVVKLIEAGWDEASGRYYLALEWAERSLADRISEQGRYTWRDYFSLVGMPIVDALAYAHLQGVEHRDLKPGNVLLDAAGTAKLADFNIAKIRDKIPGQESGGHTVAGYRSGIYAPPELTDSRPFTRDVFAFGVLAITSMSSASVGDYPDLLPALDGLDTPEELRVILRRCIDADPESRPANGALLQAELEAALQHLGARQARQQNILWLKMTQSAARGLLSLPQADQEAVARAEGAMMADLSGEVFAEFGSNRETGLIDRTIVTLAGREFRYKLIADQRDPDGLRVVVLTANPHSGPWLAKARQRACPVHTKLSFSLAGRRPDGAGRGFDALAEALEAHEDAAQNAQVHADLSGLLQDWRRVLDAREELARGELQPLDYQGRNLRGREIEFLPARGVEQAMDSQEWEVTDSRTNRVLARGEVVAQTVESVTLRFKYALKDVPGSGRLTPYLGPTKVSLTRQIDALLAVEARESVNPDLRDVIERPGTLPATPPAEITNWFRGDLDDSKRDVVRHAIGGSDLVLVEGPPGTGKTTVIAEIVQQTLARNPMTRILLVSQTHIAIDNALQRLEKANVTDMVRLGRGADDPRVADSARHLLLERQMERWVERIRNDADRYITGLAKQHALEDRHLRGAAILQELAVTLGDITHVEQRLAALSNQRTGASTITSSEPVDDIVDVRARLDDLYLERDDLVAQAQRQLGGDLTIAAEPTQTEARDAVEAIMGTSADKRQLMKLMSAQAEWLHRLEADKGMRRAFLSSRKVVAGTALGFLGHRAVRDLRFDLCIFDEASKATATETLVPLSRARRWVLVGDTRQLPPIDEDLLNNTTIMKAHKLTPELVTTTLFQHLAEGLPDSATHMLREQYRMIKPIGDLISSSFYEGRLLSPRSDLLAGYDGFGKPVLWINTEKLGACRREQGGGPGSSYANREEARLALHRLKTLDKAIGHGLINPPDGDKLDVLLIAPYSRQVDELRKRLAGLNPRHLSVTALSVDAVQGRECDLAIFTVTRSNDQGRFGFLGQPYWRRINVALSRARYGLTIVGDAHFCRAANGGALREVLGYIGAHPDDCEVRDADRS